MNFIDGVVSGDGRSVAFAAGEHIPLAQTVEPGRKVIAGVRPENLRVAGEGASFHFEVGNIESTGSATYLESRDGALQLVQTERSNLKVGDRVGLEIEPALVHLFDPETGARI
jgi:multiple sugar transport system ATP-binding protein